MGDETLARLRAGTAMRPGSILVVVGALGWAIAIVTLVQISMGAQRRLAAAAVLCVAVGVYCGLLAAIALRRYRRDLTATAQARASTTPEWVLPVIIGLAVPRPRRDNALAVPRGTTIFTADLRALRGWAPDSDRPTISLEWSAIKGVSAPPIDRKSGGVIAIESVEGVYYAALRGALGAIRTLSSKDVEAVASALNAYTTGGRARPDRPRERGSR